jgi:pseudouridine synthase
MLVNPENDRVTVHGRAVRPLASHHYLLLNKPAGFVVTARDERRRQTVFDLLGDRRPTPRLFAVGRLDMHTRGALLLTDDGELAQLLTHPRHEVPKEYVAVVTGRPDQRALAALRNGVRLEDGVTSPAEVDVVDSGAGSSELRIVIREGRNRQVRRMLDAVGHPVRQLQRTAIGPVRLGRLREGDWRRLRDNELAALRAAARR